MKDKTKILIRDILKWGSLACFLCAVLVIIVEALIPANISADQSNDIAGNVQDTLDKNHDKDTIKDISNFNINFDNTQKYYFVGDTLKYKIEYTPFDTSYKNINYEISDTSILTIDSIKNEISFLKEGSTQVVFKSEKKEQLTKTFNFNVKNVEPSSISFISDVLSLNIGDSKTLSYTLLPENVTLKNVIFASSNKKIVSVNNSGTIKAVSSGESIVKVCLASYPHIYDEIKIKVNSQRVENIQSLSFNDVEIYNNQTKEFYIEYSPISSTLDSSKLKLDFENKNLTLSNNRIDKSKGRIYFKAKYKNNSLLEVTSIQIKVSYLDITGSFNLNVLPQVELNKSLIDNSKLKLSYKGSIISSSYYSSLKNFVNDLEITIPFVSEVSKNKAKYALKNYSIEISDNLDVISSTYNKIKIHLNNPDNSTGYVKYFFNKNDKNDYLIFDILYEQVVTDDHIVDIKLNKFYENETLTLLPNEKYGDIFSSTILCSNSNSPLSKTPINVIVPSDYKDIIEIEYDKNFNPISIKTLKEGYAEIITTSRLEDSVNSLRKINKIYKININNFITSSHLTIDSIKNEACSIEIDKTKHPEILLNFERKTIFADGSFKEHKSPSIEYEVTSNSNECFSFDTISNEITAKKNGEGTITFTPVDKKYKNYEKTLNVLVNHTEISKNIFSMSFKDTTNDKYNKPNKDFSIVPLNHEFKISPIINEDASNKKVKFLSSNPQTIKINTTTGEAKTLKVGTSTITCYSEDNPNIKISKKIDVINTSSPFTIDLSTFKPLKFEKRNDKNNKFSHYYAGLNYGESYKLKIIPEFKKATSSKVKFTFENMKGVESDKEIVSIDNEGNILTNRTGQTWVRITYGDNNLNSYSSYIVLDVYRENQMPFKEMAYKLRKLIGHFGLFAATATSGLVFIFLQFKSYKSQALVLVVYTSLGIFIAFLSEWLQALAPGRGCTIKDALLNSFGFSIVSLSFLLLVIILYILSVIKTKKYENNFIRELSKKDDK